MDIVAVRLDYAEQLLKEHRIKYSIGYSRPCSRSPILESDAWYVIRQRLQPDGVIDILAAAKMGKEVF